ncbi:MAG: hypothetical protein VKL39_04430 [Leptolyngbyaceae bacterium]|nr:hypothetical protein [Leptolyngbyaceae bacterium]
MKYSFSIPQPLYQFALRSMMSMVAIATLAYPVAAQQASNFGVITLSSPSQAPQGATRGHTQGSVPLASMARHDSQGNMCVGFAESEPDHVLNVQDSMGAIALRVDSNGGDTTLLVQAENGTIWCGDDAGGSTDARVQIGNLTPGNYQVWVGSFDPGVRYQYQLHVD